MGEAAVAATSVLFGLVHAYQGLAGMADTAIMGALLGTLHRVTRRNLWASIVAHGVMDTIGFVMIDLGIYPGL